MPKGHAVIDGSNLATEGRKEPSLAQLDEAVRAIDAEYDFEQITVVVDATFEHRVAKSETKAARAAIDDGDIITPPAGVIGRGDAFILQVADRADAVVFSNDSFQEFHGTYDWLFDEGRLVGGKPIPSVGWIYVARSPVRGPVSRRATADNRKKAKAASKASSSRASSSRAASSRAASSRAASSKGTSSRAASTNDDTSADRPKIGDSKPAPEGRGRGRSRKKSAAPAGGGDNRTTTPKKQAAADGSNDAGRWQSFREDFPVGSTIAVQVDRFSSHGAYGSVDDVVIYLPNRLLADPAPSRARDVLDLGTTIDFVVHRYDTDRKGIDAGLVPVDGAGGADKSSSPTTGTNTMAKKATKKSVKKAAAKRPAAKKAAKKKATKKAAPKKTAAKKATKKAPAKKTAAKKTAKKAPAKKTAKKTAKKRPAAKKTAKKAPAKKTAAKKTAKKTTKKAAKKRR